MPSELVRKHIWLNAEDWEFCELYFKDNVGTSKAIRMILHEAVLGLQAKAAATSQRLKPKENVLD